MNSEAMIGKFTIHETAIVGTIVTILVLIGLSSAAPYDSVTVNINVTQEVSIDVQPTSVSFLGVSIGSTTAEQKLTITNIGSVNISTIDANITNANTKPFGTGNPNNYDSGDYIVMNASNNASYYYINSKHWNFSVPVEVTEPTDWSEGASSGYFGFIRTVPDGTDVGYDYRFFTNVTTGDCTGTASLLIGNEPKNATSTGSVNFTNSGNYTTVSLSSGEGDIPDTHGLGAYCVEVSADCSQVTLFHFNMDLDSGSNCGEDQYVYGTGKLEPGNSTSFYLRAKVPLGVQEGDLGTGTMYLIAAA